MPLWTATFDNMTPETVADATNFTDAKYLAVKGGSTSQMIEHIELMVAGLATASGINRMVFGRDVVVGATLSGGSVGAQNPNTAAFSSAFTAFTSATTKPQRATAANGGYMLLAPLNCFGGIFRWRVPIGEGILQFGNAAYSGVGTGGEMSLSGINGTNAVSTHLILEPK